MGNIILNKLTTGTTMAEVANLVEHGVVIHAIAC